MFQSPNLGTGKTGHTGGSPTAIYRLTLDMAKELAMVENNDQGRLVRRYFIWADDQRHQTLSAAAPLALDEPTKSVIGGIVKKVVHGQLAEQEKVIEEQGRALAVMAQAVNALVAVVQPSAPGKWRPGKTAGEILFAAGIVNPPKNVAKWLGNRLEAAGCRVEGKSTSGLTYARMFDPDKSEAWLKNGGKAAVEKKIDERKGQGALVLTGRAPRPVAAEVEDLLRFIPEDMRRDGIGVIALNGEPVLYDIRDTDIHEGDRAVMVLASGEVVVDHCRPCVDHRGMGPRSVMCAPRPEILPRRTAPMPVEWQGVILGKVVERRNVILLPARETTAH